MCRWLVYSGTPVLLNNVLYGGTHSLIDQSLHSRIGVETTNGDGFGVGWYGDDDTPAVFRSIEPAWNDQNLRELAGHGAPRCSSPISGRRPAAPCSRPTATLPPRPLAVDANGEITEFRRSGASSSWPSTPNCSRSVEGSTDSELMFFLALTFGLDQDPPGAVARMAGS